MTSTVRALILDFGEVLTRPQPRHVIERMASMTRLPVDQFLSRYWRHRNVYDGGLTGQDFGPWFSSGTRTFPRAFCRSSSRWMRYRGAITARRCGTRGGVSGTR